MKLIDDTMKTKEGKWSRTSLTMLVCLVAGLIYSFWSLHKYGFDFWVYLTFMGVATGMKVIDIFDKHKLLSSKKETPKDEAR